MPFNEESQSSIDFLEPLPNISEYVIDIARQDNGIDLSDIEFLFKTFRSQLNRGKKAELLQAFMENRLNPNNHLTFLELKSFAEKNKIDFGQIADAFFSMSHNPNNNFESLLEACFELYKSDENKRKKCFWNYLENTSQEISLEKLAELTSQLGDIRETKHTALSHFFANENNRFNRVNFIELSQIILQGNLTPSQRSKVIVAFLKNPNNPKNLLKIDELKELINRCQIVEFNNVGEILEACLGNKNNPHAKLPLKDFISAVASFGVDVADEENYAEILKIYLAAQSPETLDRQALAKEICNSIRRLGIEYDFAEIEDFIKSFETKQRSLDYETLFEIAQNLYATNEVVRMQFISPFLAEELKRRAGERGCIRPREERAKILTSEDLELIRNILTNLSNDAALDLIAFLQAEADNFELKENDLLLLLKGRAHSRYKTLVEALEKKSLQDVFAESAIADLRQKFGANFLQSNNINAVDILSYFDLKDELENFHKLVKPPVMTRLATSLNNISGAANLLLSEAEVAKIHQILSGKRDQNFARVAQNLISAALLCNYFTAKIGVIPPLNRQIEYQFDFSGTANQEMPQDQAEQKAEKANKRQKLNALFNRILFNPNQEDVVDFFCQAFAINIEDVKDNRAKMLEFFKENLSQIAFALTANPQKSAEITTQNFLEALMPTLVDGCSKNISSQFSLTLYSLYLKDSCDKFLYSVLCQIIIPQIVNNRMDMDAIETGNPLTNPNVTSYYIAPEALLARLSQEFYHQNKKGNLDAWALITEKYGAEIGANILEILTKKHQGNLEEIEAGAAKIAAYIIINSTIETEAKKLKTSQGCINILQEAQKLKEAGALASKAEERGEEMATLATPPAVTHAQDTSSLSSRQNSRDSSGPNSRTITRQNSSDR